MDACQYGHSVPHGLNAMAVSTAGLAIANDGILMPVGGFTHYSAALISEGVLLRGASTLIVIRVFICSLHDEGVCAIRQGCGQQRHPSFGSKDVTATLLEERERHVAVIESNVHALHIGARSRKAVDLKGHRHHVIDVATVWRHVDEHPAVL